MLDEFEFGVFIPLNMLLLQACAAMEQKELLEEMAESVGATAT